MSSKEYKISRLAQNHLIKIKNYTIDTFSEQQWQHYKEILISGFQLLADNPKLGKSCDDVYPESFYFPIGKHTAYFTKEKEYILIIAVLGQSQLPQNHLK